MKKLISMFLVIVMVFSVCIVSYSEEVLTFGDWDYVLNGESAKIVRYNGASSIVAVPAKINGRTVSEMDGYVFSGTAAVTVNLPTAVTKIGPYVFSDSEKLMNVFVPVTTKNVSEEAFSGTAEGFTLYTISNSKASAAAAQKGINVVSLISRALINLGVKETSYAVKFAEGSSLKARNKNVSVSSNGKITALKQGKGVIDVSLPNGITSYMNVQVKKAPSKITGIPASLKLYTGLSYTLKPSLPSGEYASAFTYSSSKPSAVSISSDGVITAAGAGTAVITTKVYNGVSAKTTVSAGTEASSVKFTKTSITVAVGEKTALAYKFGSGEISKSVSFSSSSSCASVNSSGVLTGKKVGKAKVTVKTYGGCTDVIDVKVVSAPSSVKLSRASMTMGVKENVVLKATVKGGSGLTPVKWSTSSAKIAKVSKNGTVTASAAGKCYIYAKTYNGKSAKCLVNVKKAPSSIKLNKSSITIGVGEKFDFNTSLPSGTASCSIKASLSKSGIVSLAPYFIVTAKAVGKTTITVKTYNGKKASCVITVKKAPSKVICSPSTVTIPASKSYKLSPKVNSGAGCYKYTYKSSNTKICKVTSSGTVKAYKNGNCNIYVYAYNHRANKPVYTKVLFKIRGMANKVASYTTYFSTSSNVGKCTNLKLACKYINGSTYGYVLMPGETFSFNKAVGIRTRARGFVDGLVVSGDGYTPGIGGGICQGATTVFNAVLYSNLQITERHNHTLKSSYVPNGRDATVSWGTEDFKFKNNFNTPIRLRMTYNSNGSITATIFSLNKVKKPKISLKVNYAGGCYTLKRYANGKCNYTCSSRYRN